MSKPRGCSENKISRDANQQGYCLRRVGQHDKWVLIRRSGGRVYGGHKGATLQQVNDWLATQGAAAA